jgi:ribonuclease VapC
LEPGEVKDLLGDGSITAANWSEVLQKVSQHGGDPHQVSLLLRALGLDVTDVTRTDGERAAQWNRSNPLSMADRLCLAVAHRLRMPAVTAESRWAQSDSRVEVQVRR